MYILFTYISTNPPKVPSHLNVFNFGLFSVLFCDLLSLNRVIYGERQRERGRKNTCSLLFDTEQPSDDICLSDMLKKKKDNKLRGF